MTRFSNKHLYIKLYKTKVLYNNICVSINFLYRLSRNIKFYVIGYVKIYNNGKWKTDNIETKNMIIDGILSHSKNILIKLKE